MPIPLLPRFVLQWIAPLATGLLVISSFNALLVSVASSFLSIAFETVSRTIALALEGISPVQRNVIMSGTS